jgi:hypothetical protein
MDAGRVEKARQSKSWSPASDSIRSGKAPGNKKALQGTPLPFAFAEECQDLFQLR